MKQIKKLKYVLAVLFIVLSTFSYGQMLAPEDPGGEPEGPPLGGSAPVSEGAIILVLLATGYGISKTSHLFAEPTSELPQG